MGRFALKKPASPDLADKFAVSHGDLAAYCDGLRTSGNRHAFERIVINIHRLRFRGDGPLVSRIVNNQIGVAAELDGAFARKQSEQSGRLGAGGVDKTVQIEPALSHTIGVECVDSILK